MMSRQQQKQKLTLTALALALFATATSGCGQQSFEVSSSQAAISAPGVFTIPAKVDILLGQDDSGSMIDPYNQLKAQFPGFLNNLDSSGWDYHFATVSLTRGTQNLGSIVAGHYDVNWMTSGGYINPIPGAQPDYAGAIPSWLFSFPSEYNGFVYPNNNGSSENGLESVTSSLESGTSGTNFLRSDAMLVVLIMSTGEDTSKINYCTPAGYVAVPCGTMGTGTGVCTSLSQVGPGQTCDSRALALNSYKSRLLSLKSAASQLKVYSVVPASGNFAGIQYMNMASQLGGQSYDISTTSISTVLTSLSSKLQSVRVGFRTHYIFMSQHPDTSSITVTKYSNGVPTVLPQNATNGWTYVGDVQNVYAIDYPTNMNLSSGIAIRLNGSAELSGTDTATVDYTVNGLHNSN